MKLNLSVLLGVATLSLIAAPALRAQCCGGMAAASTSCPMMTSGSAQTAPMSGNSSERAILAEPAQSVFSGYIKIQNALAQDSFAGVHDNAAALVQAFQNDSQKTLPAQLAERVTTLAGAKDIASAREAFKPFSRSLIDYLKTQKLPPGAYYEVYCPMADASWVQTDKVVANPYFGKAMLHCGQIKN